MVFLLIILILLSCYVAISGITDETKTAYFIVVAVLVVLVLLVKIF